MSRKNGLKRAYEKTLRIPSDKIGLVIGSGGKTIQDL
jgi:polyribonucleotide nucleotidyltransferase